MYDVYVCRCMLYTPTYLQASMDIYVYVVYVYIYIYIWMCVLCLGM